MPLVLDDGKPNQAGKAKQEKPLPKACSKCHLMKPVGVHTCPACGFTPERQNEIVVADGELVKLERKRPIKKDTGQYVYSQLIGYAQIQGYKLGWAFHHYAKFFSGKYPHGLRQVAAAPTPEILSWIKSRQIAQAKAKQKQGGSRANR